MTSLPAAYAIRMAREDDLGVLREIEVSACSAFATIGMQEIADDEPFTIDELEAFRRAGRALVVVRGKVPVAYLLWSLADDALFVEQVSVDPSQAGLRLGAALIDHATTLMPPDARTVILTTFRDVPWNAPYYARLGFRIWKGPFGPELSAIVDRETRTIRSRAQRVVMRRAIRTDREAVGPMVGA